MANNGRQTVTVFGAGIAGAACARALTLAGHSVSVFDRSRGPGVRLATRSVERVDREGQGRTTRLDHGAVGIATSEAFQTFVGFALRAGWPADRDASRELGACGDFLGRSRVEGARMSAALLQRAVGAGDRSSRPLGPRRGLAAVRPPTQHEVSR